MGMRVNSRPSVNTRPPSEIGAAAHQEKEKPVEVLNQHRARMEQCPKRGEEGVNTVFPRLANIDSKPKRTDMERIVPYSALQRARATK